MQIRTGQDLILTHSLLLGERLLLFALRHLHCWDSRAQRGGSYRRGGFLGRLQISRRSRWRR